MQSLTEACCSFYNLNIVRIELLNLSAWTHIRNRTSRFIYHLLGHEPILDFVDSKKWKTLIHRLIN